MLVFAGFRFTELVREYLPALVRSVESLVDQLAAVGIDADVVEAATAWLDPARVLSLAGNVSTMALSIATAFFFGGRRRVPVRARARRVRGRARRGDRARPAGPRRAAAPPRRPPGGRARR